MIDHGAINDKLISVLGITERPLREWDEAPKEGTYLKWSIDGAPEQSGLSSVLISKVYNSQTRMVTMRTRIVAHEDVGYVIIGRDTEVYNLGRYLFHWLKTMESVQFYATLGIGVHVRSPLAFSVSEKERRPERQAVIDLRYLTHAEIVEEIETIEEVQVERE